MEIFHNSKQQKYIPQWGKLPEMRHSHFFDTACQKFFPARGVIFAEETTLLHAGSGSTTKYLFGIISMPGKNGIMSKKRSKKVDSGGHISDEEINVAAQYDLPAAVIGPARETLKRLSRKVEKDSAFIAVKMDGLWDNDDFMQIRQRMFVAAWLANRYSLPHARSQMTDALSRVEELQTLIEKCTQRLYELTTRERPSGTMHHVPATAQMH